MSDFATLIESVTKGDIATAVAETERLLGAGSGVGDILDSGLIVAMNDMGERFAKGQVFVPQVLRSAKTMHECMRLLEPYFKEGHVSPKGKVLIGTVKGDLHDIGKNLVSMMMEGAGFMITDLGVDVTPERFAQKAQEVEPDIIAMSALLSTTMPSMLQTIEALNAAGVRDKVKVMVGGAPVTERFSQEIGADGYAPDAGSAVTKAKGLLGIA